MSFICVVKVTVGAVINESNGVVWYLSGIYASTKAHFRQVQWDMLKQLQPVNLEPWMCMGDYNDISHYEEKRGGRPCTGSKMQKFNQMLHDCSFMDMGFSGQMFTWSNNKKGRNKVLKRLDRVVCNLNWRILFPNVYVQHIANKESDNKILCIKLNPHMKWLRKPFRFEQMWLTDVSCKKVIEAGMDGSFQGSASFSFCRHLAFCRKLLRSWNVKTFGHLDHKLKQIKSQIQELEDKLNSTDHTSAL
ncbi:hypothetical protein IFM89_005103 [Coptis chinensis]|uniref:Exo_endo_phos domain-containing protein n=1 Tax=Coptis chinensis TaxID=261450 RepID=A0A835M9T9_9MAGN|nr:hypothetical protein IFM89_005103 [Coptis chinensis]